MKTFLEDFNIKTCFESRSKNSIITSFKIWEVDKDWNLVEVSTQLKKKELQDPIIFRYYGASETEVHIAIRNIETVRGSIINEELSDKIENWRDEEKYVLVLPDKIPAFQLKKGDLLTCKQDMPWPFNEIAFIKGKQYEVESTHVKDGIVTMLFVTGEPEKNFSKSKIKKLKELNITIDPNEPHNYCIGLTKTTEYNDKEHYIWDYFYSKSEIRKMKLEKMI